MCCVNMFLFPTNLCALLLNILSIYNCNLCSCLANYTQQRIPEWPLLHIFLFVLILCLMEIILLNELGFMFHKGKKGVRVVSLCALSFACSACFLRGAFQNVSFSWRVAILLPETTWESGFAGQLIPCFSSF